MPPPSRSVTAAHVPSSFTIARLMSSAVFVVRTVRKPGEYGPGDVMGGHVAGDRLARALEVHAG
jgi:hypothetical protein